METGCIILKGEKMDKTKLQWHPAFGAALRITLQDEMQYLEMHEEYLLSKKPLQMDILIYQKTSGSSDKEDDRAGLQET